MVKISISKRVEYVLGIGRLFKLKYEDIVIGIELLRGRLLVENVWGKRGFSYYFIFYVIIIIRLFI